MRIMLIILMTTVSGCAEKNINNRWVGAVNKLGIIANYPPREGISVGRIYLQMATNECEKGYERSGCEFSSTEIATLDKSLIRELIDDANKDMPDFRIKSTNCPSTLGNTNHASPTTTPAAANSTIGCYTEAKITDTGSYFFRRVGFPDYSFVRDGNAGVSAILPSSLASRLGFTINDVRKQEVSVPNAVYYSISMPLMFEKLNMPLSELQKKYKSAKIESFKSVSSNGKITIVNLPLETGSINNLELTASQFQPNKDVQLTIIIPTEVYYASIFNVTLFTKTDIHAGVNDASESNIKDDKKPQFTPDIKDNKINNDAILSGKDSLGSGVAATINYVTQNSISLKNRYDTLLAIGYRGINYRVSPNYNTPGNERFRPWTIPGPPPPFTGQTTLPVE